LQKLTIVAPAFNEEEVITEFYRQVKAVLTNLADRYETSILFVVDQCTDRTPELLTQIAEHDKACQVLFLSSRFGHQMSLVAGLDYADADVIIMMDSDLQHPPGLIPKLIAEYENGAEIVSTKRTDGIVTSTFRRWVGGYFYKMMGALANIPMEPNSADFRLITRRVAKIFREQIREQNQFLRGLFAWVGFRSAVVEFQTSPRFGGSSKYSLTRLFTFAAQGIVSFSTKPLVLSVYLGAVMGLAACALIVFYTFAYFINDHIPSGWSTLAILILAFGALQLMMLGVIGLYIGAIFAEVKHRPLYIVEGGLNLGLDQRRSQGAVVALPGRVEELVARSGR
jgi:glycosyltransferase involved in cell wall biosynthesis